MSSQRFRVGTNESEIPNDNGTGLRIISNPSEEIANRNAE